MTRKKPDIRYIKQTGILQIKQGGGGLEIAGCWLLGLIWNALIFIMPLSAATIKRMHLIQVHYSKLIQHLFYFTCV